MSDDNALDRAKRALTVVPRGEDDALTRAKRALAPADNSTKLDTLLQRARAAASANPPPAVIAQDTAHIDDLLNKAKAAARPAERKRAQPPEPLRAADVSTQEPARNDLPREAPRNPPPAVIANKPNQIAARAPQAVDGVPAEAAAPNIAAPGQQNVVVNVQVAAPYPVYPYGYPYWHPYWAGCPRWNCPLRSGVPCRRWMCGW